MSVTAIDTAGDVSKTVKRDLDRLRESTGQVVGAVFYGTLLKTMRESVIKGRYGHGGRGEEVFGAQLDAFLARRMGTATRGSLGETLYRRFERQQTSISELRLIRGPRGLILDTSPRLHRSRFAPVPRFEVRPVKETAGVPGERKDG